MSFGHLKVEISGEKQLFFKYYKNAGFFFFFCFFFSRKYDNMLKLWRKYGGGFFTGFLLKNSDKFFFTILFHVNCNTFLFHISILPLFKQKNTIFFCVHVSFSIRCIAFFYEMMSVSDRISFVI
jgi:hypothetical protein